MAVQQADVVNMDETGWREEKQRAWLWTAVTPSLTAFLIDRSRGSTALTALLGEAFAGIVGSDRRAAYSRFPAERRALCYAHLKRDFQALVDRGGEAAPIGRWGWRNWSACLPCGTGSGLGSSTEKPCSAG